MAAVAESDTMAMSPMAVTTDTNVPFVDPEVEMLRLVYLIATKYAWMVTVVLGLFGNAMSIMITLQKDNRRISTCNYMTALAVADSIALANDAAWKVCFHVWSEDFPTELDLQ
jgi:hypothetical protein